MRLHAWHAFALLGIWDDFEYPALDVLEQGSRNIEPIATLVSVQHDFQN